MALLSDESPLSKPNMLGKRLSDDNGGSMGFSSNFKRPRTVAAPQSSRYRDPVPGFHETGLLKVRGERAVLPVNPLRMLHKNGSFEPKKLKNVAGNPDLANERQQDTLCKQNDGVISLKTSSQIRPCASKYPPQKIQLCDPVPQYAMTRVSEVRIQRTRVPRNPCRILTHDDSFKPKEIANAVKGTPKVKRETECTHVLENATLHKRSDDLVCLKMQSLDHVAHNLPPGVGERLNCISSCRPAAIPGGKSGVEQMVASETTKNYDQRFSDELDENGFCVWKKIREDSFQKLFHLMLKLLISIKVETFSQSESYNPSNYGNQSASNRSRVREILNLFDKMYEDAVEAKSKGQCRDGEHISTTATRIVKQKINWVNSDELGPVGGVERIRGPVSI